MVDAGGRGLISQIDESAGIPATRRSRQKAREIQKARVFPATWRRPRKSAGNPAIRRRSTTRKLEGSTKTEGDRRTIDPGSNDAIDDIQFKAIPEIEDEVIQRVIDPTLIRI